jgi:hypothetical protein
MKDKPSTLAAVQAVIDAAMASGMHKIDSIVKVEAGQSPFISKPEWTAENLIKEAGR